MPLYNSHIICFYSFEGNYSFSNNQLVFWDDINKANFGLIIFPYAITNFYLIQHILFVQVKNILYVLEVISLSLNQKITAISAEKSLLAVSYPTSTISYINNKQDEQSIIHITQFFIGKDRKISTQLDHIIQTNFTSITKIQTTPKGDLLIAVSKLGNKIHIYSLMDLTLKYCFYLGKAMISISNISLDDDQRFLSLICDSDELLLFKIKDNQGKYVCMCHDHKDSDVTSRRKSSNSFLSSFTKFFTDESETYLSHTLENIDAIRFYFFCAFQRKKKKEMIIVGEEGVLHKLKLNKREKENSRVNKVIHLISNNETIAN